MEQKHKNNLLTGMIIGGVVGGTVALLTATRTGEETRELIADKSVDIRDKAVAKAVTTRDKVGELTGSIVDDTREKVDLLKKSSRRIKDAETEVISECVQEAKKALKS